MPKPRNSDRVKIKHVVHKGRGFRSLKQLLRSKGVIVSLALLVSGGFLLTYSLGHSNVINSPFVEQGQLTVSPTSNSSFQFGQPMNHVVYLNFTAPGNDTMHYILYKMPAHQVAFYSSSSTFSYGNNYFMHQTEQIQIPSQLLSKFKLVRSGTAYGGSMLVINGSSALGQQYLLIVSSASNSSFIAQVSANSKFQLIEGSDLTSGLGGAILSLAGIFSLAISISRVHKNLK